MKKSVAILAGLGLGAAALAFFSKKMPQNEEKAKQEKELEAPRVATDKTVEELPKTNTVTALSACFYTPNSVVWHADRECFYIRTAAEILSGNLESANIVHPTIKARE